MRSTGAGNASAEYESGWYSSLALAAVTEPTPSVLNRALAALGGPSRPRY